MSGLVVGVAGLAGAGKSTVAEALESYLDFAEVSLAGPLKSFVQRVFAFSDAQVYGSSSQRNGWDSRYPRTGDGPMFLTPRFALQTLGVEWGRACYENVWVDLAMRTAKERLVDYPGVVIPDVRFRNEIDAIKAAGGKVIRLTRGTGLTGEAGQHSSETEQASIGDEVFDFVLDNSRMTVEESQAAAVALVRGWM